MLKYKQKRKGLSSSKTRTVAKKKQTIPKFPIKKPTGKQHVNAKQTHENSIKKQNKQKK